jgi:hypothetical protein
MTQLHSPDDPEALPEEIVHWQPHHGHTFALPQALNEVDGPVVATAIMGVLAMVGLAAGAFILGRRSAEH